MKIAINGDIHGRKFWKKSEELIDDVDKVVFLGDYLSPYPHEGITDEEAIDNFNEILEFKRKYPEKVVLLLGNHDLQVSHSLKICDCRTDVKNYDSNRKLYRDNMDLFTLFYWMEINGQEYFFSHAGISDVWIKHNPSFSDCANKSDVLAKIGTTLVNSLSGNEDDFDELVWMMRDVSFFRGGMDSAGSIVWRDVRETISDKYGYQIFGHTMLSKPIVMKNFACLDCQETIILNDNGELQKINGNKIELYN